MVRTTSNFYYLLAALLFFLIALPIADDLDIVPADIGRLVAYSCVFLIGIWSMQGSSRRFRVSVAAVVAGMLLNALAFAYDEPVYLYGSIATLFVFLLMSIVHALKQVLISTEVSANRLVGVICVYLLLGTLWALIYSFLELVVPGSFRGIGDLSFTERDNVWIYFSFVTLTTLGYGDVTPVTGTARVMVYTEAIFGMFYMAVLVAGLVGSYMSAKQESG